MAHYAKVENGIVIDVNVAEQDWVDEQQDKEKWIQTSYNSRGGVHYLPDSDIPSGNPHLRYNYAQIGGTYDKDLDAFIPISPVDYFILDKKTCTWIPPIPYPTDGKVYLWNVESQKWDEEVTNSAT